MALIKCQECGKEISDKAVACPHCGCPISVGNPQVKDSCLDEADTQNSVEAKVKQKKVRKKMALWKKILIAIIIPVLLFALWFGITVVVITVKYTNSFNNIAPYLDYVGVKADGSVRNTITEDLYNNIEDVEFWGKNGIVSYETHDGYIVSCTWSSFDFVSEEEYRKFAEDLFFYFDDYADVQPEEHIDGNTYEYCYVDTNYDFDVRVGHDLFIYDPEGQIDIRWSCSNSQLQIVEEEEEPTEETETEDERNEVRDHDEFKSVITDCLALVPDCDIYFGSEDTGSDDSYAIKVDDTIIGILGMNMDSYDVIALIDDGKDSDGLYLEQISVAMIMSCDSSIDCDEAYKIYQETNNDDSVRIKSGIYGFKGVVDGMDAFAIDISWL